MAHSGPQTSWGSGCAPDRPRDIEAEKQVIGDMLIAPEMARELLDIAPPEAYDDELAQAAAYAIDGMLRDGDEPEVRLVLRRMRQTGGDVGEFAGQFLADVVDDAPVPSSAKHYANLVAEAARKRRVLDMALSALDDLAPGGPSAEKILERITSDAASIATVRSRDPWAKWEQSLHETDRRVFLQVAGEGSQLNRFRISKGRITVLGGPQGGGKTLITGQFLRTILEIYPDHRLLLANCEMELGELMDRHLASIAQVPYSVIRDRRYTGGFRDKVLRAAEELLALKSRICWMEGPFTMARVRAHAASFKADVVCIDYLQRFSTGDNDTDFRMQVSRVMSMAREIASTGPAVVMLSALSRQGEFRESSEVEFAADYCYKLEPNKDDPSDVLCKCLKARNAAKEDIPLSINHVLQEVLAPAEDTAPEYDLDPEPFDDFAAYGEASVV